MTVYSYLDQTNNMLVKVPLRYPEELCDPYDIEQFMQYVNKHPDERAFLIDKHQLDKRIFRRQASKNGAHRLGGIKHYDCKPCEKIQN